MSGNIPSVCAVEAKPRLTKSATSQTHIQGFELAHPNTYPISDLLEQLLLNDGSSRVSMTQDNRRISQMSFGYLLNLLVAIGAIFHFLANTTEAFTYR
ncbi:small conductance calcium-activated potassium channel protein 2 [Cricetulus griseus]|uniref:Small conductance calcium-activated potassium channel protein 2 n=1 Tax=Cricetulus griseus TaxID=10029 RepID=A0A061IJS8_CRIGR|nr:small conductance calcium-activated potassium channel protein 2 [Cricetulus griseus]